MKRTRCKTCECKLTKENSVGSGIKENGDIRYRPDCKLCYAVQQKERRPPKTIAYGHQEAIERAKKIIVIPLIPNINSNYGWLR